MWADRRLCVGRASCGGLGVFATETLTVGARVGAATVELAQWHASSGLRVRAADGGHACLFGPLALFNAACAQHANVRFGARGDIWTGTLTRGAAAGDELFACYTQPDEAFSCPVCATRVAGSRGRA
jgi:hypothetical protein